MSLQQALRERLPSVDRVKNLRHTLAVNRWAVAKLHFDPRMLTSQDKAVYIKIARQAFFTAQDELVKILERR